MKSIWQAKNEIDHKVLNEKKDNWEQSARYTSIGQKRRITQNSKSLIRLKDKVIYPINLCPHCGSKATFHRRIQKNGDIVNNVYNSDTRESDQGLLIIKTDYCLDCHKEFIIEIYIFEKYYEEKKKESKKKNWFQKLFG